MAIQCLAIFQFNQHRTTLSGSEKAEGKLWASISPWSGDWQKSIVSWALPLRQIGMLLCDACMFPFLLVDVVRESCQYESLPPQASNGLRPGTSSALGLLRSRRWWLSGTQTKPVIGPSTGLWPLGNDFRADLTGHTQSFAPSRLESKVSTRRWPDGMMTGAFRIIGTQT